ncbi:MAG: hypothetical protein RIC19_22630 [Phaeodactylibacter sp.]|uniref:antibiotic biosynthesis monooxygenase family protein n=1 Tax=Phaeodactylibacter sp. TaxID=1940289 RepID=UPI0032EE2A88
MKYLILFVLSGLFLACSPVKKGQLIEKEAPVFEIAVRKVKEGMKTEFVDRRADFITKLKQQDGVSNDREFQSFYALPEPDQQEVFIGMTQYATGKTVGKVQSKVLGKFLKFAKTMDLKAYVFVQPTEGGAFDLGSLASKPGQVLEVAVRRVKPGQEAAFDDSRKAFVSWLDQQAGLEGSWEFKVVGGQDTDNLTVGMSVYESQEAFQAIAQKAQSLPEAGAYFSTFDPVALQYAVSTTNQ